MNKFRNFTQWFYFNPFFGEANIEGSGHAGVIKSGVNIALWSGAIAGAAALAGSKRPLAWGAGTFGVLVIGEVLFGLSGHSTNGSHMQVMMPAPPTAASPQPWAGTPGASVSFADQQDVDDGYAEGGNGFN